MGRRGLRPLVGLLAALALLVVPGAATAAAQHAGADGHDPARVTAVDRHATVAHVVARVSSGRERRSPHHSSSSHAILGGAAGVAPGVARTDLVTTATSAPGDLPSSSRPRAPPAVV